MVFLFKKVRQIMKENSRQKVCEIKRKIVGARDPGKLERRRISGNLFLV